MLSRKRIVSDTGPYPDPEGSNPHPSVSVPKVSLLHAQIHTKSVISLTVPRQQFHYRVIMKCLGVAFVCLRVTNLTILSVTRIKNRRYLNKRKY
jgi:hypothetical protein